MREEAQGNPLKTMPWLPFWLPEALVRFWPPPALEAAARGLIRNSPGVDLEPPRGPERMAMAPADNPQWPPRRPPGTEAKRTLKLGRAEAKARAELGHRLLVFAKTEENGAVRRGPVNMRRRLDEELAGRGLGKGCGGWRTNRDHRRLYLTNTY